jgi:WS/DGAT/MGAT family acyltransferase
VATTLTDARKIRSLVPGATLNDAMLACIAGGVRALMLARGETIDNSEVRVFIPVSLRSEAERDGEGGNRISGFVAPLPVAEPDPLARLRTIQATTAEFKNGKQPLGIHLIAQWVEFLPAPLLKAGASQVIQRPLWQNLTVTNVQGPKEPLYLLGARMLELNPMVPLGCQLSLNVAVESYVDDLRIGLSADADWLPDLDVAKRGIEQSLRELLGNIRGEPDPTAATQPGSAGADGTSKRRGKGATSAKRTTKRAASRRV